MCPREWTDNLLRIIAGKKHTGDPDNPEGRRWQSILLCEQLIWSVVASYLLAAANGKMNVRLSTILRSGQRGEVLGVSLIGRDHSCNHLANRKRMHIEVVANIPVLRATLKPPHDETSSALCRLVVSFRQIRKNAGRTCCTPDGNGEPICKPGWKQAEPSVRENAADNSTRLGAADPVARSTTCYGKGLFSTMEAQRNVQKKISLAVRSWSLVQSWHNITR